MVIQNGADPSFDQVGHGEFTPDGKRIAFLARIYKSWDVATVNLSGGDLTFITHGDGTEGDDRDYDFAASPNGRAIVIAGNTWGGDPPVDCFLYVDGPHPGYAALTESSSQVFTDPDWQPV